MTQLIWEQAFQLLMINEGGFVNNPNDKGGKTNFGITQATFNHWNRLKGRPMRAVYDLTLNEAKEIYHELYWLKFRCDRYPDALSVALFDFCVQSKPPRPTKFLQQCLGVPADGITGNQTIGAAWRIPLEPVVREYLDKRLAYYMTLESWKHFSKGWTNRINRVRDFCLNLL